MKGNKTVGAQRPGKVRDASTLPADLVGGERRTNQTHQFYSIIGQKGVFMQSATALSLNIGSVFYLISSIFDSTQPESDILEAALNIQCELKKHRSTIDH